MTIVSLDQRIVPYYSALRRGVRQVSVHRHAINIVPEDKPDLLLALVDREVPFGPRQLRFHALPSTDNDLVACFQGDLPPTFSCTLRIPQDDLDLDVIEDCWRVLAEAASPPPDAFHAIVQQHLQHDIAHLCHALQARAALDEAVCALLGLGMGLTPSGDDVLTGLVLALHLPQSPYHERFDDLRDVLKRHLHRTHVISAAFIRDALCGEVGAPMQSFICLLYGDYAEKGERDRTIHALTTLGHSSGYDLLSGILAGLSFHPNRRTTLCPCIAN